MPAVLFKPSRVYVERLKVGSLAPDCFGHLRTVTRVFAAGNDYHGKAYVCYYTTFGDHGAEISHSLTEGELALTAALSCDYTAAQLARLGPTVPESDTCPE